MGGILTKLDQNQRNDGGGSGCNTALGKQSEFELDEKYHSDYHLPETLNKLNYDCWELILSFIEDPIDLYSLLNLGFPQFDEILERKRTSILLSAALPILMRGKNNLRLQSILTCRLLNRSLKDATDECLAKGYCVERFPLHVFYSDPVLEVFQLQTFVTHAESVTGNPFILHYFFFNTGYNGITCDLALRLLQNSGHFLRRLRFTDFFEDRLSQALTHCPNIEYLSITSGLQPRGFNGSSLELTFPPLRRLEHLWVTLYEHRIAQFHMAAPWARSILVAYGPQLRTLHCDHTMFLSGIGWETFSSNLHNLEELEVKWLNWNSGPLFEILSKVKWPKLKCLYLKENDGKTVDFTTFGFNFLENFATSLEDLHLPKFEGESWLDWLQSFFKQTELNSIQFPLLRRMRAHEVNVDSVIWSSFPDRFINLESIRFEMDIGVVDDEAPSPILKMHRMEWFFSNFSKFQYILWPRRGYTVLGLRDYIAVMKDVDVTYYQMNQQMYNPVPVWF
ncbi:unnamed protein product [Orchesella dallaii]|uniref:Uncharacterized protein n=1 Tax=Orchesella dallaii TaxID=48710 RepID=A0ABP1Q1M3_9HEXA